MSTESTMQTLCDLTLRFGGGDEDFMSRPFGVSLLFAGQDENELCLYYTDLSGTFWQCDAKSIGYGVAMTAIRRMILGMLLCYVALFFLISSAPASD
jgi:20S proteasome alpha/beta subunit